MSKPVVVVSIVEPGGRVSHMEFGPETHTIVIGASPRCTVRVASDAAQPEHARIDRDGAYWYLTALSERETWRNAEPVGATERVRVATGDRLRMGDVELILRFDDADQAQAAPDSAPAVLGRILNAAGDKTAPPRVRLYENGRVLREYALAADGAELLVGRAGECDIVVQDSRLICREHARIKRVYKATLLYDLMTPHGTFVNGEVLEECTQLIHGDIITLARADAASRGYYLEYLDESSIPRDERPPARAAVPDRRPSTALPPDAPRAGVAPEAATSAPAPVAAGTSETTASGFRPPAAPGASAPPPQTTTEHSTPVPSSPPSQGTPRRSAEQLQEAPPGKNPPRGPDTAVVVGLLVSVLVLAGIVVAAWLLLTGRV